MKYPWLLGLTLLAWPALAQTPGNIREKDNKEDDVLRCSRYRYGIYKAFAEFRRNAPSITQYFRFDQAQAIKDRSPLVQERDYLFLLDARNRPSPVTSDLIWGFCDGKAVYVYFGGATPSVATPADPALKVPRRFRKLTLIDRYCYFADEAKKPKAEPTTPTPKPAKGKNARAAAKPVPAWEYVLNINDGEVYELSVANLKRILSKDPELFGRYEREAVPETTKYQYLTEFNKRNPQTVQPLE